MQLYRWSSKLLQGYGEGDLIAFASTAREARNKLRAGFDDWVKENREWAWANANGLWGGETDTEELDLLRATFEADLAAEPSVHETLWIRGSD